MMRNPIAIMSKVAAALLFAIPCFAQVTILTNSLPTATVGMFYAAGFTVAGGTTPYAWSGSGNIPPGMTVSSGGSIVGTPAMSGTYTFTLSVVDARNLTATRTVSLTVIPSASLAITTTTQLPTGTVGQNYSVTLQATGGLAPYRWTANGSLPPGLTLDAQTGILSGVPSSSGLFTFHASVTDAAQAIATVALNVTFSSSALAITTTPPLFAGTVGLPYSQTFSASGGKPPYTWSITSGNPGGLTLDSATGTLHGTPQASGAFAFVAQVSDTAGRIDSKSFSLVVNPPAITITAVASVPAGVVGVVYNEKLPLVASGGTAPYRWSIMGSVAPGLALNPDTLTISGTPESAGTFSFTAQVTDALGQTASKTQSITIAPPGLTLANSRQLPAGSLNVPYSATLTAVGGAPPYSWSAAGLPVGLSINSATGVVTGLPAAAGDFAVAVTVTDSALNHVSDRFTMTITLPSVPAVLVSGLPSAASAAGQYPITVTLAAAYPAPITGQAVITFAPDSGPTDKTVQFASGGTVANFSIPAGSTTPSAAVPLAIQTGTVAGTINVSIRLQAGGTDITPIPAPTLSTQLSRAAPVITDVRVSRSEGKLSLAISGYTTAREVTQAVFNFVAAAGQTLQASAASISIPVQSLFDAWFQDPANGAYGSQFILTQPFTVQGDANAVIPQSVTLTNRVGSTTFPLP